MLIGPQKALVIKALKDRGIEFNSTIEKIIEFFIERDEEVFYEGFCGHFNEKENSEITEELKNLMESKVIKDYLGKEFWLEESFKKFITVN